MLKDLSLLKEPFPADHIEWRLAQAGKNANGFFWGMCLAYVQARAIMDRLDEVIGPMSWKAEYSFIGQTGVVCRLSIKDEKGEWLTKEDGAEMTDIEPFKGGISGALKRAAVLWGIGRYLYDLESGFVTVVDRSAKGAKHGQTKDKEQFYWLPPTLPAWAQPKSSASMVGVLAPGTVARIMAGPAVVPIPVPALSTPKGNPGEYVVPFNGRTKGKKLKDLTNDELHNSRAYWETEAKQKALGPVAKEYLSNLITHMDSLPKLAKQSAPDFIESDIPF